MANKNCNYCHAPITFTQNARGKWVPTDPHSGKFHRCKLEQRCQDCRQPFEGSPWMKQCPDCWKAQQPNQRGFARQGNPDNQRPHRQNSKMEKTVPRETLNTAQDDFFDDIPF